MKKGWQLVCAGLELAPPQPLSLYLGCVHERKSLLVDGASIRDTVYSMDDFLRSCVDLYGVISGSTVCDVSIIL